MDSAIKRLAIDSVWCLKYPLCDGGLVLHSAHTDRIRIDCNVADCLSDEPLIKKTVFDQRCGMIMLPEVCGQKEITHPELAGKKTCSTQLFKEFQRQIDRHTCAVTHPFG